MATLVDLKAKEIHDISPVETVSAFVEWMYNKACSDRMTVFGRIEGVIYSVDPSLSLKVNLSSIVSQIEKNKK